MPRYTVKTIVEFVYEVEADNEVEAEKQGWEWEDYTFNSAVESIDVEEIEEEEEEEA